MTHKTFDTVYKFPRYLIGDLVKVARYDNRQGIVTHVKVYQDMESKYGVCIQGKGTISWFKDSELSLINRWYSERFFTDENGNSIWHYTYYAKGD